MTSPHPLAAWVERTQQPHTPTRPQPTRRPTRRVTGVGVRSISPRIPLQRMPHDG